MFHLRKPTLALALLILLLSCATQPTPTPTSQPPPTALPKAIVIGDVSTDAGEKIERFQPLADYLAVNLNTFGVGVGQVTVAPSLDKMTALLKADEIDLVFDSPYPAMIMADNAGAQPLLRRWKGGVSEYNSIIFALRSSGVKSLADLKGKMIGFEDVNSTSGYFMPAAKIREAGLTLAEKPTADSVVGADEVGYTWTSDDEDTVQWILSGKVIAGGVDSVTFAEIPPDTLAAIVVLGETEKLPRHIVLVRPGMDPAMVQAIKKLLLDLDKSAEGQAILKKFEKTSKFDEFTTDASLDRMRALYALVQGK